MVPTVNDVEGISLTIPVGIKEGVMKNKINKNDGIDEGKDDGETTDSGSTTANNEESCGNVDIENFYDIFGDLDEHITENTTVWMNTKKTIWEGTVIKITYSEKSEDSKYLKVVWINTKNEQRVLIKDFSK